MLLYFSWYGIAYCHHERELLITRLCQQSSFKSWLMMCSILAIMTCIYRNGLFTLLSQSLTHHMLHKCTVQVFVVKHTLGQDASSTLISLCLMVTQNCFNGHFYMDKGLWCFILSMWIRKKHFSWGKFYIETQSSCDPQKHSFFNIVFDIVEFYWQCLYLHLFFHEVWCHSLHC